MAKKLTIPSLLYPLESLTLDELGRVHEEQIAALERTREALAAKLLEERKLGGRNATWARLAQRSGYAGPSSVRKVVENATHD